MQGTFPCWLGSSSCLHREQSPHGGGKLLSPCCLGPGIFFCCLKGSGNTFLWGEGKQGQKEKQESCLLAADDAGMVLEWGWLQHQRCPSPEGDAVLLPRGILALSQQEFVKLELGGAVTWAGCSALPQHRAKEKQTKLAKCPHTWVFLDDSLKDSVSWCHSLHLTFLQ